MKKIPRRYPAQRPFFGGEIPQDTVFILKILCERYATKQSVKGNCLPNKLRMEISSKQIPKETSTKDYLEKPAYQKNPKRNLYEKNLKRKLSPPKKSNNLSTNNYVKKFYQGNSEETFPAKLRFEKKSIKTSVSRDISLPSKLKKRLYEKSI